MKGKIITLLLLTFYFSSFSQEYTKPADAIGLVNQGYWPLAHTGNYSITYMYLMEMSSDDVTTKYNSNDLDDFNWTAQSAMSKLERYWEASMLGILRANLALEKVPMIKMDPDLKKRLIAEAKFLRGFYYFHFTNAFGDVPLYTTFPKDSSKLFIPRTARNIVYQQIKKDLDEAARDLPVSYHTSENWRATKGAATAFLGKVYLFDQKWTDAAAKLKEVVDMGVYTLTSDFDENFDMENEHCSESIFEVEFADLGPSYNGWISEVGVSNVNNHRDLYMGIQSLGNGSNGPNGFSELIATSDLHSEFEGGDPRRRKSLYTLFQGEEAQTLTGYGSMYSRVVVNYNNYAATHIKDAGNGLGAYFHIRKAVNGYSGNSPVNSPANFVVLRYADVLLMLAEALNESGNLVEGKTYLNMVRKRARNGMTTLTFNGIVFDVLPDFPYKASQFSGEELDFTNTKEDLRKAIVHERRVELAFEYVRLMDIRRWDEIEGHPGGASTVFTNKPNLEDRKTYSRILNRYFRVPQRIIDLSKGTIMQNPGY